MLAILLAALGASFPSSQEAPEITITADNTAITKTCRVKFATDAVIADADGNGVIHVKADGVTITFTEGQVLRGARPGTAGDELKGIGLRIEGRKGVTLRGVRVSGFKVGIYASAAPGLVVEDAELRANFRHHLKSTPIAEDGADWLWPHKNDQNEWLTNYGAGLYVEDTADVTVRRVRVREGQNGVLLDRVTKAKIYDNDLSFLSGWGLGLWRSSDNLISRNAIDFCVRGYSHGVYNRGQDSAGLLMFEQCSGNVIVENSVTHGGDGIFGFAGNDALEQEARAGNNGNLFLGNDLSYAPAHGLEMTFSFDNVVVGNRFAGNAICGLWGGYSQATFIRGNRFEANGEMAYGLERGGINIEHGTKNVIVENAFAGNKCGIHLWDSPNPDFAKRPWGKANHKGSCDNQILRNTFENDAIAVHLRANGRTWLVGNTMTGVAKEIEADDASRKTLDQAAAGPDLKDPAVDAQPLGETRPVGARKELAGREHIIMTEWGPWDHRSPLVRLATRGADAHLWELHQLAEPVKTDFVSPPLVAQVGTATPAGVRILTVRALAPGAFPYRIPIEAPGFKTEIKGTLINAKWKVRFFPWEKDPREDPEAFRREAQGKKAVEITASTVEFRYGQGGPSELGLSPQLAAAQLPRNRFGTVAETLLPMKKGKWRVTTQSDDGVRVTMDRKKVIENWTWHGPTRDTGEFTVDSDRAVRITVEHFELDGFATLSFDLDIVE